MSFIGIRIPHETARLIHEIEVPGEKEDTAQLHITLLYLGEDTPIKDLAKAMIATYEVTQSINPFWVKLACVSYFPSQEDNPVPIIAPVVSTKLNELHCMLKKSFDKTKVDYSKKFKEYKPHVTLSFNEEPIKKTKIEPIEWSVQELVLWGGSDGDNRIFTTFPLEIRKNEEIQCMKKVNYK